MPPRIPMTGILEESVLELDSEERVEPEMSESREMKKGVSKDENSRMRGEIGFESRAEKIASEYMWGEQVAKRRP